MSERQKASERIEKKALADIKNGRDITRLAYVIDNIGIAIADEIQEGVEQLRRIADAQIAVSHGDRYDKPPHDSEDQPDASKELAGKLYREGLLHIRCQCGCPTLLSSGGIICTTSESLVQECTRDSEDQ